MTADVEAIGTEIVQAISDQDWERVRALCAPGYVHHAPGVPSADLDRYIQTLQLVPQALPDLTLELHQVVATDEYATMRYTVHGTFTGEFHGIQPTGAVLAMPTLGFVHVVDGLLVEGWYEFDSAEFSRAGAAGASTGSNGGGR